MRFDKLQVICFTTFNGSSCKSYWYIVKKVRNIAFIIQKHSWKGCYKHIQSVTILSKCAYWIIFFLFKGKFSPNVTSLTEIFLLNSPLIFILRLCSLIPRCCDATSRLRDGVIISASSFQITQWAAEMLDSRV